MRGRPQRAVKSASKLAQVNEASLSQMRDEALQHKGAPDKDLVCSTETQPIDGGQFSRRQRWTERQRGAVLPNGQNETWET